MARPRLTLRPSRLTLPRSWQGYRAHGTLVRSARPSPSRPSLATFEVSKNLWCRNYYLQSHRNWRVQRPRSLHLLRRQRDLNWSMQNPVMPKCRPCGLYGRSCAGALRDYPTSARHSSSKTVHPVPRPIYQKAVQLAPPVRKPLAPRRSSSRRRHWPQNVPTSQRQTPGPLNREF